MEYITEIMDYIKKLQRAIDNADLTFFKYKFVKKQRVDDLLVCILTKLPDSFKKAMKRTLTPGTYTSVSCFNRLSKIIKKPFALNSALYMVDYAEANTMIKGIKQNLERDIHALEQF